MERTPTGRGRMVSHAGNGVQFAIILLLVLAPTVGANVCDKPCGNQTCYDWYKFDQLSCFELRSQVGCDCTGCCHEKERQASAPPPPPALPGATDCHERGKGLQGDECVACEPGSYATTDRSGKSACQLADSMHYVPEEGSNEDGRKSCPRNTQVATPSLVAAGEMQILPRLGARSISECRCQPGSTVLR